MYCKDPTPYPVLVSSVLEVQEVPWVQTLDAEPATVK
jgi:hypothetical protein